MPETIPIACTLERSQLPDRAQLIAELGTSLIAVEAQGRRATLRFESGREALESFIRAESDCCAFFDFALADERGSTTLQIGAPEGAEWALRGLVAGFVAGWGELV